MADDDGNLNEKLIECVRERPPLWDNSCRNYSDRNIKQNMWLEVAHNLNMTDQFVKTRWKSLRDRYMKASREMKGKSGQAATSKCEWPLKKYLDFLRDTVAPRNTTESTPMSEDPAEVFFETTIDTSECPDNSKSSAELATLSVSSLPLVFSVPMQPHRPSPTPSPTYSCSSLASPPPSVSPSLNSVHPPKRSKKDKDAQIDEAVLQYLSNSRVNQTVSQPSLTADDHFYLSVAKEAQSLTPLRSLQLRQFVSTKLLELKMQQESDSH